MCVFWTSLISNVYIEKDREREQEADVDIQASEQADNNATTLTLRQILLHIILHIFQMLRCKKPKIDSGTCVQTTTDQRSSLHRLGLGLGLGLVTAGCPLSKRPAVCPKY